MTNPFDHIDNRLAEIDKKLMALISQIQPPVMDVEFGGVKIAVEVTGLSTHSIYRLVSQRKIPHFKKGAKLYFSRKALVKWLEDGGDSAHSDHQFSFQCDHVISR